MILSSLHDKVGSKVSAIVLLVSVLMFMTIFLVEGRLRFKEFEDAALLRAVNSIDVIEAVHTQSMLFRLDTADNDPAVNVLNGTFEQLSDNQDLDFWLVMGLKVEQYQRSLGHTEIEPPSMISIKKR
jgi:hypothetical protein